MGSPVSAMAMSNPRTPSAQPPNRAETSLRLCHGFQPVESNPRFHFPHPPGPLTSRSSVDSPSQSAIEWARLTRYRAAGGSGMTVHHARVIALAAVLVGSCARSQSTSARATAAGRTAARPAACAGWAGRRASAVPPRGPGMRPARVSRRTRLKRSGGFALPPTRDTLPRSSTSGPGMPSAEVSRKTMPSLFGGCVSRPTREMRMPSTASGNAMNAVWASRRTSWNPTCGSRLPPPGPPMGIATPT